MVMSIIKQPAIEVFGVLIQEPMTTFTDLIVCIISLYAFFKLSKAKLPFRSTNFFKWYFLLIGIATFLGGILGHAFLYHFSEHWKIPGWFISMLAIMLIERSAIIYSKNLIPPYLSRFFLRLNIVELVTLMTLSAYYLEFKFVEFHCVYGFIVVVFSFHLYTYVKTKNPASKLMLYAVGVLAIAMFIFNYPIVLHTWFNNSDFAHIMMAICSLILLKAALKMKSEPKPVQLN